MEIESFQNIIADFDKGSMRNYDILVSHLRAYNNPETVNKLQEKDLLSILKQIHQNVVKLTRQYAALVSELLKLDWLSLSNEFQAEYQSFILNLISAHTALYLHEFIRNAISNFKPKTKFEQIALFGMLSNEDLNEESLMFDRNHELIALVFEIVPSTILILQNIVPHSFPHYRLASNHCQVCFVRNMFRMIKYTPTLRLLILQWIFKHIIQFDSEASRQEILASEDDDEEEAEDMFPCPIKSNEPKMKLAVADILDCLMLEVFQYIKDTCYIGDLLLWDETKKLYLDLLKCFDSLLLTTFKTCHIQFILFYICSFKMELAEHFVDYLWKKVLSPNNEVMYRQLSASYLGSFLSRASYLTIGAVKQQLQRMKEWIHRYIDNCTDTTNRPDIHGPFYSVCQSFFYIIVFTHKNIIDTQKGQKFCMGLHLQKISSCRLNPLRFCLPAVAETFCTVVRNNHIAFCDTVLEKNRRQMMSEMVTNSHGGGDGNSIVVHPSNFLISYFPFDPYLLLRSREVIKDMYQEYDNSLLNECNVSQECISEEMDYLEIDQLSPSTTTTTSLQHTTTTTTPSQRITNINFSPKLTEYFLYSTSPGFTH